MSSKKWARVGSIACLTIVGVLVGGAAHAVDYFGALAVYDGSTKVSEASGGAVYLVYDTNYDKVRVKITFRDVTADGQGTYAKALQDGWDYGAETGWSWQRMHNDETNKYSKADGWRTSYMTEGAPWAFAYRSNPMVCHNNPWYLPDKCDSAGWQYP
jgi:hypothetical protein